MKKVLLSIISIALYVAPVYSSNYMFVKKTDNQTDKYDVEDVKQVTYEEELSDTEGKIGDYDYIDLGLPSKIKWATCNVGATSPTEYGDQFAWGETEAKSNFSMSDSRWLRKSPTELLNKGVIDHVKDIADNYSLGNLRPKNDAATALWGKLWRTPTLSDISELRSKCKWTWTKLTDDQGNDVRGYKVTGPNGKSIFLPAAGYNNGFNAGSNGMYWSSTASSYISNNDNSYCYAYCLFLYNDDWYPWDYSGRSTGGSIRPVSEPNINMVIELTDGKIVKYDIRDIKIVTTGEYEEDGKIGDYYYVDLGLTSGTKWATCNVGASVPEGYGDNFAWGETKAKETYTKENCEWTDITAEDLFTKGVIDAEKDSSSKSAAGHLTAEYDVATVNWGESWRMPTNDEVIELMNECLWEWTTYKDAEGNDVNGYEVTGLNGKSIFIPSAGYNGNAPTIFSRYWTSTAYNNNNSAFCIRLSDIDVSKGVENRNNGYSVRPVLK